MRKIINTYLPASLLLAFLAMVLFNCGGDGGGGGSSGTGHTTGLDAVDVAHTRGQAFGFEPAYIAGFWCIGARIITHNQFTACRPQAAEWYLPHCLVLLELVVNIVDEALLSTDTVHIDQIQVVRRGIGLGSSIGTDVDTHISSNSQAAIRITGVQRVVRFARTAVAAWPDYQRVGARCGLEDIGDITGIVAGIGIAKYSG